MPPHRWRRAPPWIQPRSTSAAPSLPSRNRRRTSIHPTDTDATSRATKYDAVVLETPVPQWVSLTAKPRHDQGAIVPTRRNRRSNEFSQPRSVLDFELTFLGDALERLAGILDAILIIIAVGRQQPDDLIASARTGATDRAGRVEHGLTDAIFMRPQCRRRSRHHFGDGHRRHVDDAGRFRLAHRLPRRSLPNRGLTHCSTSARLCRPSLFD